MKTLILNNLALFFKDKKAVVLTFLLPIGLVSLFMMIFGGTSNGNRGMGEFEIGVADLIQDKSSQKTVIDLDKNKSFVVEPVEDSTTLKDQVHKGKLDAGVIIYKLKGSDEVKFEMILDGAKEVENNMLKPTLGFALMGNNNSGMKEMVLSKIKEDFPDFSDSDAVALDNNFDSWSNEFDFEKISTTTGVKTTVLKPDNGINPGAIQAVSGNAIMTLLFAVAGMGAGIIEEKERGTLRRILMSRIRPLDFMFAKFFSSIIIAFCQLSVTLLFCWVVFDFPVFDRPLELSLLLFFTSAAAASFGIFLAGICETRKQIESLSTIVVLLMSLLGGSMIPSFVMPPVMQKFSMLTINYWAGDGFFDLYYRNVSFAYFSIKLIVLSGFCAVLLGASTYFFKKKLRKIA